MRLLSKPLIGPESIRSFTDSKKKMSAGHHHSDHGHDHRGASKRHLAYALAIVVFYMIVEVVGGFMTGSLSLLAHAGHMLTDSLSMTLALVAMYFAERKATPRHTYGFFRFEVLAALANLVILWLVVVELLQHAFGRLHDHAEIEGGLMLIIALGGLVANIAVTMILYRSSGHSVNVAAAFTHAMADLLGSVGVVVSGALIWLFHWHEADLVVTVLLCLIILWSTWGILKRVLHVLLEGVPKHIDVHKMCRAIEAVPGVGLIHDIHVWTLTQGIEALTAHVIIDPEFNGRQDDMLIKLREVVSGEYGIKHLTIQLETKLTGCEENHHVDNLLALAEL